MNAAMKALGTSVYTTSGYLNGANGKPGLAAGIAGLADGSKQLAGGVHQVATGTDKLADGATLAASKGQLLASGAKAAASGASKLSQGAAQLAGVEQVIDDKVAELLPEARAKALQKVADEKHLSVVGGKLTVNYGDPVQRQAIIDQIVPTLIDAINNGDNSALSNNTSSSDTSFLNGADARLTKPFLVGFNSSVVTIYWVGLGVMLLAFGVACFFRVPPLRENSALQERANTERLAEQPKRPADEDGTA